MSRVMVTGAGGPAGYCFIKSLAGTDHQLYAVDMDRNAAGLFLVPEERRFLVPRGDSPEFVPTLLAACHRLKIDILVPTVDSELLPLSERSEQFATQNTRVMVATPHALAVCLDKYRLALTCKESVPVPRTELFTDRFDANDWSYPVIIKPRRGSGGHGVVKIENSEEIMGLTRGDHLIVQEYLPGNEYSVDVLVDRNGSALAAVPRERMKVDSGVAVTSRTLHDAPMENFARRVCEHLGLSYVANVQFRRDSTGLPKLMEINARFPGTMPNTIASGVHMPLVALDILLGRPHAADYPFVETTVVRTWQEHVISNQAILGVQQIPGWSARPSRTGTPTSPPCSNSASPHNM